MRVEHEGCDAKGQHREPEVKQVGRPDGHGGIEEQEEVPHAHVNARTGETGVENRKRDTRRCETTTCSDVPGTTERQIAQDGLRVDLSREDFEDGGKRQEVLSKTDERLAGAAFEQLCVR